MDVARDSVERDRELRCGETNLDYSQTERYMSPPEIRTEEYKKRVARVQAAMDERRLDAILITSEDNYRYLTGFNSPTWVNLTRPRFCIIPRDGTPFVIVPSNNTVIVEETSWIRDIRSWVSPNPADDGVTLVIDGLRSCGAEFGRIGAELGPQSRLTMPVGDFLRICEALRPTEFVDCNTLLQDMRQVKSLAEVEHIRRVTQAVSSAFEALPSRIHIGNTEHEVCRQLEAELLRGGVEKVAYLVGVSGYGGYSCIHLPPGDRILNEGDVMAIDIGCTYRGYFCDFDREFCFGESSDTVRKLYDLLWRATEAGIAAAKPGRRACDIWQAQADVVSGGAEATGIGVRHAKNGRMGHGLGLRLTEPPSIHPEDTTELVPGMVLTIEPAIAFPGSGPDEGKDKVMVHEENLVITRDGSELLTRRAPREMPCITQKLNT